MSFFYYYYVFYKNSSRQINPDNVVLSYLLSFVASLVLRHVCTDDIKNG